MRISALALLLVAGAGAAEDRFARSLGVFADLGEVIGASGMEVVAKGEAVTIYTGGRPRSAPFHPESQYWAAIAVAPNAPHFRVRYVSEYFPQGILRLDLGTPGSPGSREVVVALTDGGVIRYDEASRVEKRRFDSAAEMPTAMTLADVDADGVDEILIAEASHLWVHSGDGELLWDLPGVGGELVVAGQLDSDAGLEIALADGSVVDSATRLVQWNRPEGAMNPILVADVTGDGRAELVAAFYGTLEPVRAYDLEADTLVWEAWPGYTNKLAVANLRPDLAPRPSHLILGASGRIKAFDLDTLELTWDRSASYNLNALVVADLDRDAQPEILASSGLNSFLYFDADQPESEVVNERLDGPFAGPLLGDLDGDGLPEIVTCSWSSYSGYEGGRVVVLSGHDLSLRAVSDPIVTDDNILFMPDIALGDGDGDERLEIYAAHDLGYDATISVFGFGGGGLKLERTLTDDLGSLFESVDVADVDSDGELELVTVRGTGGGAGQIEGLFLVVYDLETFTAEWTSPRLASYYSSEVPEVRVADADGDGRPDIVIVVRRTGSVWIFSGTGDSMDVIPGDFKAVEVAPSRGRAPQLLFGDKFGNLHEYRYSDGGYHLENLRTLTDARIDGLTRGPAGALWVGSGGRLHQFRIGPQHSTLVWRSGLYGTTLGGHVVFPRLRGGRVVTSGTYGVHELAPVSVGAIGPTLDRP